MSVFTHQVKQIIDDHWRRLMRHRERYVKAWIAETGLRPSECEIVEELRTTEFGFQTILRVRHSIPSASDSGPGGRAPGGLPRAVPHSRPAPAGEGPEAGTISAAAPGHFEFTGTCSICGQLVSDGRAFHRACEAPTAAKKKVIEALARWRADVRGACDRCDRCGSVARHRSNDEPWKCSNCGSILPKEKVDHG